MRFSRYDLLSFHTVEAITQVVPVETIQDVIDDCQVGEARKRKLPASLTLLLCIAMN